MPPKGRKKRARKEQPPDSSKASSSGSGSENDGGSENNEPVETLVAGRARRATAGNRLSTLLDREADDELELLFAEDEEDVEFEGHEEEDEGDERFESSSSSDDDDPGDGDGDAELAGEKVLEREARAERQATKRKAQDALFKVPTVRRKVPKVEPTEEEREQPTDPKTAARTSKTRAERLAWPASAAEGATRASMRTATVHNKEVVQARMREHEERRLKQIAGMEQAAKKRAGQAPKAMTQEERLEEARKVERLNSKSLNRWEATEKKRAEEEKERLQALQNRRLEGEVISWYSGRAEWAGEKIKQVGRRRVEGEGDKEGGERGGKSEKRMTQDDEMVEEISAPQEDIDKRQPETAASSTSKELPRTSQSNEASFLDGIHYYASLPSRSQHTHPSDVAGTEAPPASTRNAQEQTETHLDPTTTTTSPTTPRRISSVPELSTRNLIILENFDVNNLRPDRDFLGNVLIKRKMVKPQKTTQSICPMTNLPARYRDPETGIPYRDKSAYASLQRAKQGKGYVWSGFLGAYVGSFSSGDDPKEGDGITAVGATVAAAVGAEEKETRTTMRMVTANGLPERLLSRKS